MQCSLLPSEVFFVVISFGRTFVLRNFDIRFAEVSPTSTCGRGGVVTGVADSRKTSSSMALWPP